jgi:hypothetical protein
MQVYDELDPDLKFQRNIPAAGAEFWQSLCKNGGLPKRRDIDPVAIPPAILPHILLIDVEGKFPPRFRWRLIGTHTTNVLGRDSTGKYIDAVLPTEIYNRFIEPLCWIIANRKPARVWGHADHVDKDWVSFENLIAPLVDDSGDVTMIFSVAHYGTPDR